MLISIITTCLNAEATLHEALASVEFPSMEDVEHLLIDGCSTDGTLAEAARHAHVRVLSEPDSGIYDGMNKGARLARGEWVLFLQADDWLPEGALAAYLEAIGRHPDAQMICGDAQAIREGPHGWEPVWSVSEEREKELTVSNIALGEPMINARLIRRETFLALGGFSLEYSLASDRDFLLRAAESGILQVGIAAPTYRYRWHAGSSTMTEGNALSGRLFEENLAIARAHLCGATNAGRQALLRWHTRLTVQGAMNALEKRGSGLVRHIVSGCSRDIFWSFSFVAEILKSLPGFLARGCRTRSSRLCAGGMCKQ